MSAIRSKTDLGPEIAPAIADYIRPWTSRGISSVERGGHVKKLHLQVALTIAGKNPPTDDGALEKLLRELIRKNSAVKGVKICVKVFQRTQTRPAMVGYCLKDEGKAHYATTVHNITTDEIRLAKSEYARVAV